MVACRPGDFNYGLYSPDGSDWEIDGELYPSNPRFFLEPNDYEMLRLWRLFQGGMAPGYLPEAGGIMDQAAIMLDAFCFMTTVEGKIKRGELT